MIDYFALALGHGLLAFAFMRLVMRTDLDIDPKIQDYADMAEAEREAASVSGRNARRNAERTANRIKSSRDSAEPVEGRD